MSETRNMQLQNKRHERRLDGKSPNDKVLTQEVLNLQRDPDSFLQTQSLAKAFGPRKLSSGRCTRYLAFRNWDF